MPGYNREIHIRNESETNPITIVVKNPANEPHDFFIKNVAIFAEDATITFENPLKTLFIRNSVLPNLDTKNAKVYIHDSKIDNLKVKVPYIRKIEDSYISNIETML